MQNSVYNLTVCKYFRILGCKYTVLIYRAYGSRVNMILKIINKYYVDDIYNVESFAQFTDKYMYDMV